MNSFKRVVRASVLLLTAILFAQCSNGNEQKPANAATNTTTNGNVDIKIAYVDGDSLMNNYNFAKDVNEAMLRGQNKARQRATPESQRIATLLRRNRQKVQKQRIPHAGELQRRPAKIPEDARRRCQLHVELGTLRAK